MAAFDGRIRDMDEILTEKEAANYLRISPGWLSKSRCYGGGPKYIKISSRVIYRRKDLEDFLLHNERTSTSDDIERRGG